MSNGLEFAGKHRGIVVDNADPLRLGRLKIRIEAAYGCQPVDVLPWAWPCLPYGGMLQMAFFGIPEVGAGVWVELQWKDGQPDPTLPVWTGTWFAQSETPEEVVGDPEDAHYYKVLKTTSGHSLTFCDKPDEEYIMLRTKGGHTLFMNDMEGARRIVIQDSAGDYVLLDAEKKAINIQAVNNIRQNAHRIDLN